MGVGIRLKEILREKGMTIKQLSAQSGISLNTLYSITKRDSKRVDRIVAQCIAKTLDIDPLSLIDNHDGKYLYYNLEILQKLNGIDGFDGFDDTGKPKIRPKSLAQSIFYGEITGLEDEKYVKYRLDMAFQQLNTDGKRIAVERVEELYKIPEYQAATTSQSTQAPPEGKDTAKPTDAPEAPPEGK